MNTPELTMRPVPRGPAAALAALEHDLDLPGSPDTDALRLLLAELTPA